MKRVSEGQIGKAFQPLRANRVQPAKLDNLKRSDDLNQRSSHTQRAQLGGLAAKYDFKESKGDIGTRSPGLHVPVYSDKMV